MANSSKPTDKKAPPMSNDIVLQHLASGLLTITMNRPDRRNALNPEMTMGLVSAARRAAEDHEVRAVLLKGAGGTFCVGGDVKSMAEGRAPLPFEARMSNLRRAMEVSRILHEMSKPVVAQLDGAAAGAGLSIALACDLRIASESVKITTAFAKVGLSGDYGGTYFLTQMLGSAKARELYLMSPVLTAQEALALGLVTRVVADAEVETARAEVSLKERVLMRARDLYTLKAAPEKDVLSAEAERRHTTVDRLAAHSVFLYLAELDRLEEEGAAATN